MALQMPYVADTFIAYPGDVIHTEVSLAVKLIDDFTRETPLGRVSVTIQERDIKPVTNLSGYHVFTDLPNGKSYDVRIDSEFYYPETIENIHIPRPDPKNPLLQTILKPKPAYPFPANATLLRGVIVNPDPVNDALVKVLDPLQQTRTDKNGEFVFYFKGIKEKDITIRIDAHIDKVIATRIKEGRTVSMGRINVS